MSTPTRYALNLRFDKMPYLDPLLKFERASTATRINPQTGLIETVAANVPRLEKDGLLIKGAATNMVQRSNGFDLWGKPETTSILQGIHSPAGADHQAWELKKTSEGLSYLIHSLPENLQPNTHYTLSLWVRTAGSADLVFPIRIACDQGDAINRVMPTATFSRYSVTYETGPVVSGSHITLGFTGNMSVGDAVHIYGAQLEAGSIATSYIPTDGAPATRAAEHCYIEATANSPAWWNPASFTICCETLWRSISSGFAFDFPLKSSHPGVGWGRNQEGLMTVSSGNNIIGIQTSERLIRIAITQNDQGAIFSQSGSDVASLGTPNIQEPIGRVSIGMHRFGIIPLNGHIRSLQILPYAVSDTVLQAMSAFG